MHMALTVDSRQRHNWFTECDDDDDVMYTAASELTRRMSVDTGDEDTVRTIVHETHAFALGIAQLLLNGHKRTEKVNDFLAQTTNAPTSKSTKMPYLCILSGER
jgi:hypothetical protein